MKKANGRGNRVNEVNKVWTLVRLPKKDKDNGNKGALKHKIKVEGLVERHKTYLVAKEGIDYIETFYPKVRFTSICLVLSIVLHLDLYLH